MAGGLCVDLIRDLVRPVVRTDELAVPGKGVRRAMNSPGQVQSLLPYCLLNPMLRRHIKNVTIGVMMNMAAEIGRSNIM